MRIAIVEDEAITVVFLKKALQLLGHEVAGVCASGEQALELVMNKQPDLVIMDINLAGELDGISAAQQIRAKASLPILFASGYNTQEMAQRIAGITNSSFHPKPLELETLRTILPPGIGERPQPGTVGCDHP